MSDIILLASYGELSEEGNAFEKTDTQSFQEIPTCENRCFLQRPRRKDGGADDLDAHKAVLRMGFGSRVYGLGFSYC